MNLSGTWELSYMDAPIGLVSELKNKKDAFETKVPNSVQWSYYEAGKLPYPYAHKNSDLYEWMNEKVWYYQKKVLIPVSAKGNSVILCFDGIDYFSRIWVNDILLGSHVGMFGGPDIDISAVVDYGKLNKIIVEVKAANWRNKAVFELNENGNYVRSEGYNARASGKIIKPWVLAGGTGAEMFFSLGMWQGVRIEILREYHIERPFLTTLNANKDEAKLHLSLELLAGISSLDKELHPWEYVHLIQHRYEGIPYFQIDKDIKVKVNFIRNGSVTYSKEFMPKLYKGVNWLEEDMILPHPKLWFPNGMGEANLYQIEILLEKEGEIIDQLNIDYGIRTVEQVATAGPRTQDRWGNWQFVINSKRLFVKGVNWMPVDILLDVSEEKYRWVLESAKNMGVQLIRVWGGGLLETDTFYKLCDELGIMVWQDFPIGNQDTPDWPQDIWEAQVVQNIFRLRNHPSLVVWCGGNEFNPYCYGNAASIGIIERNLDIFDNSRLFIRTSPDEGTMHSYPDIDPCWYNKSYKFEPWVSETGIHCMPEPNLFYELIDNKEFGDLGSIWDNGFSKSHPEFVHHFVEFIPARVPKMLSRASDINNMSSPTLGSLSEATQIAAGEFYQIFSEKMQGNYPVTTGLMPWVLKRPWPVVGGIQLMDGLGQPVAPYYSLKRTYEPIHVALDLERLFWAAGENINLLSKVTNANQEECAANISLVIYDDTFNSLWSQNKNVQIKGGVSVTQTDFGRFLIPNDYKDRYLFIVSELKNSKGELISRSFYYPRVLSQMEDRNFYDKITHGPMPLQDTLGKDFLANHRFKGYLGLNRWPTFDKGPWLKHTVGNTQTKLMAELIFTKSTSPNRSRFIIGVTNAGKIPAFMTEFDITGIKRAFYAADNFFWLAPGENREIEVDVLWREPVEGKNIFITADAWNAEPVKIKFLQSDAKKYIK